MRLLRLVFCIIIGINFCVLFAVVTRYNRYQELKAAQRTNINQKLGSHPRKYAISSKEKGDNVVLISKASNAETRSKNQVARDVNIPIQKRVKSNTTSIFSDDYIPEDYKTIVINTRSTVHLCLIAAKAETAGEIKIFVRSVILHARRTGIFFHFVVFKGSEQTIPPIFKEISRAFVNVRYELIEVNLTKYLNAKLNNKVRITHEWSGLYGVGKIFMYDLIQHVDRCIVIDVDTVFGTDPAFLWSEAESRLQPPVALAVAWFPGDDYFNSGLMLHNFQYMRKISFGDLITMEGCGKRMENGTETYFCYHDQQFLNMMVNDHKEIFYNITASWNLDRCFGWHDFKFDSFQNKTSGLFFGVAHFTCFEYTMKNVFKEGKRYLGKNHRDYIDFLANMDLRTVGDYKIQKV